MYFQKTHTAVGSTGLSGLLVRFLVWSLLLSFCLLFHLFSSSFETMFSLIILFISSHLNSSILLPSQLLLILFLSSCLLSSCFFSSSFVTMFSLNSSHFTSCLHLPFPVSLHHVFSSLFILSSLVFSPIFCLLSSHLNSLSRLFFFC